MADPIRILHVVGSLGIGGIQSYLMSLYRKIDRTRIQFDFVVHIPTSDGYEEEVTHLGGKIYYIKNNAFVNKEWNIYHNFWKEFYREHPEYRIVHGHIRSTSAIYLYLAKKEGIYTIAHSHANSNGYGKSAKVKDILQFPTRYIADYFMGCSKAANEWMFGVKIANSSRCQVLHNGIDVDGFIFDAELRDRIREELGLENSFVIGNVGRMVPQKNQMMVLEAFEKVLSDIPNAKLMLVGDGPLMKALVMKAKELSVDEQVLFLGNRSDVAKLLQAMDVFTLSSKDEGLGIAAIEAQAAGLRTIVSHAIQEEVFITDLCIRVEKDSVDSWKNAICSNIEYKRKNMSRDIVENGYSIQFVADMLCEFYLDIIDKE